MLEAGEKVPYDMLSHILQLACECSERATVRGVGLVCYWRRVQ